MTWSWVDAVFGGILLLSVLVGCWRGLVFELMSLVGWLVAYFAALVFAPRWATGLPIGIPGGTLNALVAYGLIFLGALIVWGLIAKLMRWLIHATPLSVIDRVLGGSFGFLRGAVVLLGLTTGVLLTPWAKSHEWRTSWGAEFATEVLHEIQPWLFPKIAFFSRQASIKDDFVCAVSLV